MARAHARGRHYVAVFIRRREPLTEGGVAITNKVAVMSDNTVLIRSKFDGSPSREWKVSADLTSKLRSEREPLGFGLLKLDLEKIGFRQLENHNDGKAWS